MADQARIAIDLSVGSVQVDAPLEALDAVFTRLESFLPKLSAARSGAAQLTPPPQIGGDGEDDSDTESKSVAKPNGKKRSGSRSKETYSIVDIGLDEEQREEFRSFFKSKDPKGQNDQTLVVMYMLGKLRKSDTLGWNEIFTGFRTLDDITVPAKISSVLGNMVGSGLVQNVGSGKYKVTHVGEDRVKLKLPAKAKKGSA